MASRFVHLHTHSEFSLLDGSIRIKDLVRKASDLEMEAVGLTDHGAMYGAIEFYTECRENGIKPIVGCEVYVAPEGRLQRTNKDEKPFHLILLARNLNGYQNLMRLVTKSYFEGFYYRPRVDVDLLKEYSAGLIAMSACLSGQVPRLLQQNEVKEAEKVVRLYQEIFGKENFYLELQDQGLEGQKELNDALYEMALRTGAPVVATNDVHYLDQQDSEAHDVLLCIQTGSTIEEADRLRFSSSEFYFKSENEMRSRLSYYKGALENSREIAASCEVEIPLGQMLLPRYEVPEGYDLDSYLEELCWSGLRSRYPEPSDEVIARLKHELSVIKEMGFAGYFLIMWDLIRFARQKGIRVGPGRGSAAGSIVSYILGITNIDPIRYGLLFERFLNPERRSMPDIDIDFCYERRGEVLEYVTQKYGADRVAQIITFGTMLARAATRDAGRVFGYSYGFVDRIAKLIPNTIGMTIGDALSQSPQLREEYESNPDVKRILDTAMKLEGLARQDSIHAAGVVISADDLTNYTPLQKKSGPEIVTQYKMEDIQKIGLLKMDFLGLRTLTVIDKALRIIEKTRGLKINLDDIDLNDRATYELLGRGETLGVFQLESSGMRSLLVELKPSCIEDVIAILALYRPGPLQSGMINDFIAAKRGEKEIEYPHPSLEGILKETYGIIVYQEQVMMIASKMGGFTMSEADLLRSAISKKKREVIAELRDKFILGALNNGYEEKVAVKVFDLVSKFAEYGFNKSHSAAYAMISFQTAYLKAHYPVEFMAALLTERMGDQEKVAQYVFEARRMGIEVLPPDVNESYAEFTVVGDKIRFGLAAIRNVGENVVSAIVQKRKQGGSFRSFEDFCMRMDSFVLNKRVLESMIKAGAFDSFGRSRKFLLDNYEEVVAHAEKARKDREMGQESLFGTMDVLSPAVEGPVEGPVSDEEFPRSELLSMEREMLGVPVSGHPLDGMRESLRLARDAWIEELEDLGDGATCTIAGVVTRVNKTRTKRGDLMCYLTLDDMTSMVEVVVFPNIVEQNANLLKEDSVIAVRGKVDLVEDQVKFVAATISPVAEPAGSCLRVEVPAEVLDRVLLLELKRVLKRHPGKTKVRLTVADGGARACLDLSDEFNVTPDQLLISELRDMLGAKASISLFRNDR